MTERVVVNGVDFEPRYARSGCPAVADRDGYCSIHSRWASYCCAEEPRPHPAHARRFAGRRSEVR